MSYISENLKQNEKVLFDSKMHWALLAFTALWSWILYFVPLVYVYLRYATSEIAVTNQRLVVKSGILSKNIDDVPLDKINNIHIRQSLLGRIFGYATVHIQTAATAGKGSFPFLGQPHQFKQIVLEQIDAYKQEQIYRQAEVIARSMK